MRLIASTVISTLICMIIGFGITKYDYRSTYDKAYQYSCGINTNIHPRLPSWSTGISIGSGVLLRSGYILTNKHVVDTYGDARIDEYEKKVNVFFYDKYGISLVRSGTVIAWPDRHPEYDRILDFVIIKPDNPPAGGVDLATSDYYDSLPLGDDVFAIGRSNGQNPPHLTVGVKSTDNDPMYHRASISAYFGNSGGGMFSKDGKLIGLVTLLELGRGREIVPSLVKFLPARDIRNFVYDNHLEYVLEPREADPSNFMILSLCILSIGVTVGTSILWRKHLFC